jgi:DNA-binding MarR family transcriptional regulator
VTTLYESVLVDSGLHPTQYTVLQVLDAAPNLTTTELADAIGIDQTTATRTLALITKSRLVANVPGDDRRERRWALTPAGKNAGSKDEAGVGGGAASI